MAVASLFLWTYRSEGLRPRVMRLALIGVLAGLVIMLWGFSAFRRLWFPLLFLMFMAPLPEVTIAQWNFRLKMRLYQKP